MVKIIQDMVDADPGVSMRAIARDIGCSDWLVRTIVKEDLCYKSYSLRKGKFMNKATKDRRLAKAKALLFSLLVAQISFLWTSMYWA